MPAKRQQMKECPDCRREKPERQKERETERQQKDNRKTTERQVEKSRKDREKMHMTEEKYRDGAEWRLYTGAVSAAAFLMVTALTGAFFIYTRSLAVLYMGLAAISIAVGWGCLILTGLRRHLDQFMTATGELMDAVMASGNTLYEDTAGPASQQMGHLLRNITDLEEDTLLSRLGNRILRLYEVVQNSRSRVEEEKQRLQELVSDISHQVKTPAANLKMLGNTLLTHTMPPQKQKEFLEAMNGQVEKLDFLMQALVRTSRLESGILAIRKQQESLYETLASALGGILFTAEAKDIHVEVECPEHLIVPHDHQWTAEAIFNLLDNAVKYTPSGGKIHIKAEKQEMYTRLEITDTGKGIPETNHAAIFQRFYREENTADTQGLGLGLYLTREIITRQGGYVKVTSAPNQGSTFSIYLLNR